jgi:transcription elongation GreA/GreB family factor
MTIIEIKKALYHACTDYIDQRIDSIQQSILSAREAANDETKSSAGDKYETGRAMMQIEIDNQNGQLAEAQRLFAQLKDINPEKIHDIIQKGSVVTTNLGNYFIAIGAGKIEVEGNDYFAVGISSPIGQQLLGRKPGDSFEFNGKRFTIDEVQ